MNDLRQSGLRTVSGQRPSLPWAWERLGSRYPAARTGGLWGPSASGEDQSSSNTYPTLPYLKAGQMPVCPSLWLGWLGGAYFVTFHDAFPSLPFPSGAIFISYRLLLSPSRAASLSIYLLSILKLRRGGGGGGATANVKRTQVNRRISRQAKEQMEAE